MNLTKKKKLQKTFVISSNDKRGSVNQIYLDKAGLKIKAIQRTKLMDTV